MENKQITLKTQLPSVVQYLLYGILSYCAASLPYIPIHCVKFKKQQFSITTYLKWPTTFQKLHEKHGVHERVAENFRYAPLTNKQKCLHCILATVYFVRSFFDCLFLQQFILCAIFLTFILQLFFCGSFFDFNCLINSDYLLISMQQKVQQIKL